MKTLFTAFILSLSLQAFAAVQDINVTTGASRVVGDNPISAVWGVLAGPADLSTTSPYDNCELSGEDDSFSGCHEQRVNLNHTITITFTETEAVLAATPIAFLEGATVGGTTTANLRVGIRDAANSRTGTNQSGIVSFNWADLCRLITIEGANASPMTNPATGTDFCAGGADGLPVSGVFIVSFGFENSAAEIDANSSASLTFYLHSPTSSTHFASPDCSPDSYGFCDIAVFPGDSGGTVEAIEGQERVTKLASGIAAPTEAFDAFGQNQSLPLTVERLRLYYSAIDFVTAHPAVNPDNFADIFLDTNSTSGENVVFLDPEFGGLTNNIPYIFRAATVDSSGYISHLMRRADEAGTTGIYCPDPNNTTPEACPNYSITPSEVAGLLTESSCFITSATYGSPQAHQVTLFRAFRAKYLWTNTLGRFISDTYNVYGPIGAKWIYKNPSSKKYVRYALYPFYGFAYLSLKIGFILTLTLYTLGLAIMVLGFNKVLSRGKIS